MNKHTDPCVEDVRVIESSGNVLIDLGFDPAEAYVMAQRTLNLGANVKTIAAMQEARHGNLETVTLSDLQAVLDADD